MPALVETQFALQKVVRCYDGRREDAWQIFTRVRASDEHYAPAPWETCHWHPVEGRELHASRKRALLALETELDKQAAIDRQGEAVGLRVRTEVLPDVEPRYEHFHIGDYGSPNLQGPCTALD
jgi:hypothetical protein